MSSLDDINEKSINTNVEKRMKKCYSDAKKYLLEIAPPELRENELEKYFHVEKEFKT